MLESPDTMLYSKTRTFVPEPEEYVAERFIKPVSNWSVGAPNTVIALSNSIEIETVPVM